MRILHMLPTFDTGGLGALAAELIEAWNPEDEHEAFAAHWPQTVPTLLPLFQHLCRERAHEIKRSPLAPMNFVQAAAQHLAAHGPFDGVIIYNFLDHVWYGQAVFRARPHVPVICHVGTVLPREPTCFMLESPYTQEISFLPASAAVRDSLLAAGCSPERALPVQWNGVNLKRFPVRWPRDTTPREHDSGIWGGPKPEPEDVFFGFSGRMAPGAKDFEALFKAFAGLHGVSKTAAKLVLAGTGPLEGQYRREVELLGLTDRVTFLGNVAREKIPEFLGGLDAYIMAALPIEGMSMALVEAIATALPIIATDVPANREVLLKLGCGLLASGPEELSRFIEWLTQDSEARAKLAARSRVARDKVGITEVAYRYRREILKKQGRPHGALAQPQDGRVSP